MRFAIPLLAVLAGIAHGAPVPVILISVDTLRADYVSAYGSQRRPTPAIDSLTRGGTRFVRASTLVPLTLPAHVAMLTSTYPFENGIRDNGQVLVASPVTLAEVLRGRGYRTGAFVGGFVLDRRFGLDRGFDQYVSPFSAPGDRDLEAADLKRLGADVVRSALGWIGANPSRPFFLFLHLFDLHTPDNLPAEARKRFPGPRYDAELAYADEQIGIFLAEIKRRGLYEKSLIVLTSDHGEGLGDHGEKSHGFLLYRSTVEVPLIFHWPAGNAGYGATFDSPVSLLSIAPSILEHLGIPPPASFQGVSFGKRGAADAIYAETFYPRLHFNASALWSLQSGPLKYIHAPRPELYDTAADPRETRNLYPARADLARPLRQRIEGIVARDQAARAAPGPSPEVMAKLRSLGYLGGTAASGRPDSGADPKDRIADYEAYRTAVTLSGASRFEESNRLLERVLANDASLHEARKLLALNLQRRGRHADAAAHLAKVVAAAPADAAAHLYLARSCLELKRVPEAEKELEAALAIASDRARDLRPIAIPAEELLARLRMEQKDYDRAAKHYEHLLTLDAANYDANYNLGWLATRGNRLQEGIRYLEAAVAAHPRDAAARNALGGLYFRTGRLDDAKSQLTQAAELDPNSPWAAYNLGLVHRQQGLRDQAAAQFRRALAIDPNFRPAQEALASLR